MQLMRLFYSYAMDTMAGWHIQEIPFVVALSTVNNSLSYTWTLI